MAGAAMQDDFREALAEIREELCVIKSDMTNIKADIASIKNIFSKAAIDIGFEMQEIKQALAALGAEVLSNRQEIKQIGEAL